MENVSLYFLLLCLFIAGNDVIAKSHRHKSHDGSKIVGGQEVSINDYPYQVYILILRGGNFYACGGSIISPKFVMTAAHCATGATRLYIRAGSADSDSGGQTYSSSLITVHPRYNARTYDYDIAIVRLLRQITIDGVTTRPIQLPEANTSIPAGSDLVVSGWGATSEGGESSSTLMAVTVPVTTTSYCNQSYSGSVTPRMFCAGEEKGGKDSCQGDSGGPAVQQSVQVGIVSWGVGCARPGVPGVYTDVPELRGWIRQVTGL